MGHVFRIAATLLLVAQGPPSTLLEGHETEVTSIAFSPDGKTLASGDAGGVIRLWNTKTVTELKKLQVHESVTRIAFVNNATLVSAGMTGDKGEVFLWDTGTGKRTDVKLDLKDSVRAMAISKDAKLLAIAGGPTDPDVLVYQLPEAKLKQVIRPDQKPILRRLPDRPFEWVLHASALQFLSDNRLAMVRGNRLLAETEAGEMTRVKFLAFSRPEPVSLSLNPQIQPGDVGALVIAGGPAITCIGPRRVIAPLESNINKADFWPHGGSYVISSEGRLLQARSVRGPYVEIPNVSGVTNFALSANNQVAIPRGTDVELILVN